VKEESIAEFVRRRLGNEFLNYAIDPFVAGVYAGDPTKLSVQSAFPKLYALEKNHGGLIRGAIASRRERKKRKEVAKDRARLFSFDDGMETLPSAIATRLGDTVRLNTEVEHIIPVRAGKHPVYTVSIRSEGERSTMQADVLVLAAPARAAASMIRSIDPEMAKTLESISYPPLAEVFLGFRLEQVARALDGFGFLVPTSERRKILGSIWASSLFANRAPEGCVAFTSFVGGSRNPELVELDDAQLTSLVVDELKSLIGVQGSPVFSKINRWDHAIPQYNVGYHKILAAIDRFEQNFQGAYICCNYRGGIAVGDCVMSAEKMAERIAEHVSVLSYNAFL
jgi:oxygen-dependent protoporphyrinogen oxidase